MDAIETILARRSYRGKYKAAPIPKEDLTTILDLCGRISGKENTI